MRVVTPTDSGAFAIDRASVSEPSGNIDEIGKRAYCRTALSIIVPTPTDYAACAMDCAGVTGPRGNVSKRALGRRTLASHVVSPADWASLGVEHACVIISRCYSDERTGRRRIPAQ